VRVLRNDRNLGFAGGNDTALREVTTPYAVLLNNDATPEPDWLERLLAPFDAPGAERLAAVTSKVVFAPRFLPVPLDAPGFVPGGADLRELGVASPRSASTARTSRPGCCGSGWRTARRARRGTVLVAAPVRGAAAAAARPPRDRTRSSCAGRPSATRTSGCRGTAAARRWASARRSARRPSPSTDPPSTSSTTPARSS
jgi:hypothetical protein